MDFLDSLEFEPKKFHKKSDRMRSWYLYEQYKSLERNQLEAAVKLNEKSCQDRILQQELSERRARRTLYDQYGMCESKSTIDSINSDVKSCVSGSNDSFFDGFRELDEDVMSHHEAVSQDPSADSSSADLQTCQVYTVDFPEDVTDDCSCVESVTSVVEKMNSHEICNTTVSTNLADDIKEELESAKKNIAENISLQLETVRENKQCIENYSKLLDEDTIARTYNDYKDESESDHPLCAVAMCAKRYKKKDRGIESNAFTMWTKLVSFAYQLIKLNHGNCYQDYSSQFLTAVLACDVLRRGVNKMCNILQPYISPIRCSTDESNGSDESSSHDEVKQRNVTLTKKSRKICANKCIRPKIPNRACHSIRKNISIIPGAFHCEKGYHSQSSWRNYPVEDENRYFVASEPKQSIANWSSKLTSNDASNHIRPEYNAPKGEGSKNNAINRVCLEHDESSRICPDYYASNRVSPEHNASNREYPVYTASNHEGECSKFHASNRVCPVHDESNRECPEYYASNRVCPKHNASNREYPVYTASNHEGEFSKFHASNRVCPVHDESNRECPEYYASNRECPQHNASICEYPVYSASNHVSPQFSNRNETNCSGHRVSNPMLKLAGYIDDLLDDIDS